MMSDTCAIIINYNASQETIACLRVAIDIIGLRIVVLDNGSTDDSILQLNRFTDSCPSCELIASRKNLGFAKGVNTVLKKIGVDSFQYFWLLNNDALPDPNALYALKRSISPSNIGFSGSVILDYFERSKVQCSGVRYFPWLGVGKLINKDRLINEVSFDDAHTDFQNGASLLVKSSTIKSIGLLDERFFLYSEEQDWQFRAQKIGLQNILSTDSYVYHMGSFGTSNSRHLFYYHYSKSSVLFSRKHYPFRQAVVASVFLLLITLVRTRLSPLKVKWAIKGIFEAWKYPNAR